MDKTNEVSDTSSTCDEEELSFVSHSQLFPLEPLQFGEGA
jgi:hypothetical protein